MKQKAASVSNPKCDAQLSSAAVLVTDEHTVSSALTEKGFLKSKGSFLLLTGLRGL